jgi:outer membrane protein
MLLAAAPAAAQQPTAEWIYGAGGEDIVLELGGGAKVRPAYEGADDYTVQPWPVVELHYLKLPFLGAFGGEPQSGLSFAPSFRVVPKRDDSDHPELDDLEDVDLAVELGGTVAYRMGMFRGVATVRHGFGGHEGIVGEVGLDAVLDPTPDLTVSLGPRLHFADSDYLETYLGITPAESAASGLPAYDPDGGLKGVGVDAEVKYALTERWSVVGEASYERLVGDAADSPIAELGSENQFTAALGLTYKFGLDFFD